MVGEIPFSLQYSDSNHSSIVLLPLLELQLPQQIAIWIGLLVLLVGGLLGLWLVHAARDEALILITTLVGVQLIQDAIHLSRTSSLAAIVMSTLALAGVLVQYAAYLRELESSHTEPRPFASSIAYFQDLELDR